MNNEIVLMNEIFATIEIITLKFTIISHKLKIHLNLILSGTILFEVYNVLGQKLLEHSSVNSENISIDVSQLSNRVYYLTTDLPTSKVLKFLKTS